MKRFENVKTKDDILKICSEIYPNITRFCSEKTILTGIKSGSRLNKEKETKLIELANEADKFYTKAMELVLDYHKVNSVMTGTILLDKNYDRVKELNPEELLSLSYFMCNKTMDKYDDYLKIFNKDVVEAACAKTEQAADRIYPLEAPSILVEQGKLKPENIVDYINNTDIHDMFELVDNKIAQEYLETCKKNGVNPI